MNPRTIFFLFIYFAAAQPLLAATQEAPLPLADQSVEPNGSRESLQDQFQLGGLIATKDVERSMTDLVQVGFNAEDGLEDWKIKKFGGESSYTLIQTTNGDYGVKGVSLKSSSAVARQFDIPFDKTLYLNWEWRVEKFPNQPERIQFNRKEENDYAVRIYVLVKGLTFLTPNIIQYVWDEHYPEETHAKSPYFGRVRTMVVESGTQKLGEWVMETRDIAKDYELLFGKKPKRSLQGIGIMTDSDNSKSEAAMVVRNIKIQVPIQ